MRISLNELKRRVSIAYSALSCCRLCPRNCGVNRLKGEEGICHTVKIAKVASHNIHAGEEPPISGKRGSGTIFFSSCNLRCKFCQNYPISQLRHGETVTPQRLAEMMVNLEKQGCHNINIVTGSHVVPQFLAGLYIARENGMRLPIVWNSSGYDGMESLHFLDGVVDIYMPDIKYSSNDIAEHYSSATNYWDVVRPAIKEMYRQVGNLKMDKNGIAMEGLLIRHLVLPGGGAGTGKILEFIASEVSINTSIGLMSQYFPAHKAANHPLLGRRISQEEYKEPVDLLHKLGFKNGWIQPY